MRYAKNIVYAVVAIGLVLLIVPVGIRMLNTSGPIDPLEAALQTSGINRGELEKVLRRYQATSADSLKYKAACFLIENMPYYTYASGSQLERYYAYYAWLKGNTIPPETLSDSIRKIVGPLGVLERKQDCMEIDSAYLCNNIDWAFKVWQEQPWGKNVSFEVFCEHLLPYRIEDEPLSYWRKTYYDTYNSLLDSLRMSDSPDKEDPVVAATCLMQRLPDTNHRYTGTTPVNVGHIGPNFVKYLTGSCREVTDFTIYVLRALGIPCTIDFVPMRGNVNAGHFWVACWDKHGESYMFDFPNSPTLVRKSNWFRWEDQVTTYRHTFSLNRELVQQLAALNEKPYPFWAVPRFKDVTPLYAYYYLNRLVVPQANLYGETRKAKIAYLCVSNGRKWEPVAWTEYTTGQLVFERIKKGAVMRVATYEQDELSFLTDPFYVDKISNELRFYTCASEKEEVVLVGKANIDFEAAFREKVVGGVFEGSRRPDFKETDTLFIIQQKPTRLYTVVQSISDRKYRYVRYVGNEGTHCAIAEVQFREKGSGRALSGKVMGTPGSCTKDGRQEYTCVFDGKTETSFDYCGERGWAGLDLGTPMQIGEICYTPRNADNYIRTGDSYELFYCDGGWRSVGRREATADSLVYSGVPKNALLLLRNHTRGIEERIFTYEEGRQRWK